MPRFIIALCLFLAAMCCYSNSLHNDFVLDDHAYFNDTTMNSLKFIPYHFLLGKGKVFDLVKNSSKGYYRPLSSSIHTVFNVAFEHNVVFYHLANVVFLFTVGFLIYFLIDFCFPAYPMAAFLSGLFFILHPLNSTLINYVGSGVYLAQTALMLLSLWCLTREGMMYRLGSAFFLLLSAFCHESGIALPLYGGVILLALRLPFFQRIWPICAASVAYLAFSLFRTSMVENLLRNSPVKTMHSSIGEYVSTAGNVLSWYLWRLFCPANIVFMWGTPLAHVVGWIVVLLILVLTAVALLLWSWFNQRLLFLGLGWMVAAFIPGLVGGLGRPGMICIEPHWVIFALIGFCICLGSIMTQIKSMMYAMVMVVFMSACWICLDRQYNTLWSSEKAYCYYWHGIFTSSQVPVYYLANVYQNENNLEEARRLYIEAFKTPHYTESFDYNETIGIIELKERRWEDARQHLENALMMDPQNSFIMTHLGIIAMMEKDNTKAEYYLKRAAQNKLEILARLDLAALYESEAKLSDAAVAYNEILNIEPYHEIALVNLIQIYLYQKDKANTLRIARILANHSHNPIILRNVGIIFKQYGEK